MRLTTDPARLAPCAAALLKTLVASWRVRAIPSPRVTDWLLDGGRLVYAFWHGDQQALFAYPHPDPVAQLASLSRDGELQARILARLGFRVARGSSSRGGAAAREALAAALREGCHVALAADGPRGPLHEPKLGALWLARETGALVLPMGAAARPCHVLAKTWDRYRVVPPGARVVLAEGEPFFVPPDAADLDPWRAELARRIDAAGTRAQAVLDAESG